VARGVSANVDADDVAHEQRRECEGSESDAERPLRPSSAKPNATSAQGPLEFASDAISEGSQPCALDVRMPSTKPAAATVSARGASGIGPS
jgi:hypothetical protein